jgi:ELWxxDGT repeat protein
MKTIITICIATLLPFFLSGQQFSMIELTSEPGTNLIALSSSSTEMSGKLYFSASAPPFGTAGQGIWVTDGTSQGTSFLYPFMTAPQSPGIYIHSHNNSLYIMGREYWSDYDDEPYGVELWISDGTKDGTELLKDIVSGKGAGWPRQFTSVGNQLFFSAYNSNFFDRELWITDGTEAGTTMVKDIKIRGQLTEWNNELYFVAHDDGLSGIELWKSDGTEDGTLLVKDIRDVGSSMPDYLTVYNNKLYFSAHDGKGRQLFVTDGTESGTVVVKDINTGSNPDVGNLIVFNNQLFFTAYDRIHGRELWVSDGTETGTQMLKDINLGSGDGIAFYNLNNNLNFVAEDSILYFTANDGVHGFELWRTNGTEVGTMLVIDLHSGASSSEINSMYGFNGKVYFSAKEDDDGFKIFSSDGTESGTRTFAPPGANNDYPAGTREGYLDATVFNNSLLIVADFFGEGKRLWRYSDLISSTPELNQNTFHLFPNPATNHLRIDFRKMYSDVALEIHNINGQLIERENLQNIQQHNLNVSQWSKGLYFISVISEEGVVNGKFIKQ